MGIKGRHWKLTEEIKNRYKRIKNSGRFEKGKSSWNKGIYGEKSHAWKDGISKKKGYKGFMSNKRRVLLTDNGGSHTFGEWELLKKQYDYTCPCCGRKEPKIQLTQDHIIPVIKGGSDNIENIQPLCGSCNYKKHTKIIKFTGI